MGAEPGFIRGYPPGHMAGRYLFLVRHGFQEHFCSDTYWHSVLFVHTIEELN
jgi:hypothetical protein